MYNVFRYNMNSKAIEYFNIFDHSGFYKACKEAFNKYKESPSEFSEAVRKNAFYYFAFKAEYEVLIRAWCGGTGEEEIKIDIYQQLQMNWNSFITIVYTKMYIDERDKINGEKEKNNA